MRLFSRKKKVLDYEVSFTSIHVGVRISNCSENFSNQELIKFWAYYFFKVIFTFNQYKEIYDATMGSIVMIYNSWGHDYVNCMEISGTDRHYFYSDQPIKSYTMLQGEFFETNDINTLKTTFPPNTTSIHVIASTIAILQYVQDKCMSNEADHNILYKTLENIVNACGSNADIFNDVSCTVSLPNEVFSKAVEDDTFESKILNHAHDLAVGIEEASLYSTVNTYMKFMITNEVSIDKNYHMSLEYMSAFIHYIDRIVFLYFSPDDRESFMDMLMMSSIECIRRRHYPDIFEEDTVQHMNRTALEHMNDLMEHYAQFKKIRPLDNDRDHELFDTLIWNIGRRIASLEDLEDDLEKVHECIRIFIENLSLLNTKELLNTINAAK